MAMVTQACDLVLSDVHLELPGASRGQSHVTHFHTTQDGRTAGPAGPTVDADGDLVVARRGVPCEADAAAPPPPSQGQLISIAHLGATALADVGMQVWRGECLLCDWLLDAAATGALAGVGTVLELGAGTSMATLVAAHTLLAPVEHPSAPARVPGQAPTPHSGQSAAVIFCTDHHTPSLEAAQRNLAANLETRPLSVASGTDAAGRGAEGAVRVFGSLGSATSATSEGTAVGSRSFTSAEDTAEGHASTRPVSQTEAAAVECRFRRLDWLDFAATDGSWGESARQAVEALLQCEEGGGGSFGCSPAFKWQAEDLLRLKDLDLIIVVRKKYPSRGAHAHETSLLFSSVCYPIPLILKTPSPLPLLQGDVVYDETLTEAVIKTATALLQYAKQAREQQGRSFCRSCKSSAGSMTSPFSPAVPARVILAMEKRWCFTLRDMDSCAPAFDHFLGFLEVAADGEGGGCSGGSVAGASGTQPGAQGAAASDADETARRSVAQSPKLLRGRRLDVDSVLQRLQGYDRGPDLELWELTLL